MSQETRTIQIIYGGKKINITRPPTAGFDEFLDEALRSFKIPSAFKKYAQISDGLHYSFTRQTFDYYLLLHPKPEIIFFLRMDYAEIVQGLPQESQCNVAKRLKKRIRAVKRTKARGVPGNRERTFISDELGTHLSEEASFKVPQITLKLSTGQRTPPADKPTRDESDKFVIPLRRGRAIRTSTEPEVKAAKEPKAKQQGLDITSGLASTFMGYIGLRKI